MNNEYFEKHFRKGVIAACMPVNMRRIGFVLKDVPDDESDTRLSNELPTRLLVYLPDKVSPGKFGTLCWTHGVSKLHLCSDDSWVLCDDQFEVDEPAKNTNFYSMPNNEKGHLAKGMVNIAGSVYAYGLVRSVFMYRGVKQWDNLTTRVRHRDIFADVEASQEEFVGDWVGFSAMDGFSENDIYAGGNRGDCWHYDGNHWRRLDLPLNGDISAITCTPNGVAYVGCRLGPVLAGRGDAWRTIDPSEQITHSATFAGEIYFADIQGRIYTHNATDNALTEAVFKQPLPEHMRHLICGIASCEDCLVAYTRIQAYAYDGRTWHEIIEIPSLSKNK